MYMDENKDSVIHWSTILCIILCGTLQGAFSVKTDEIIIEWFHLTNLKRIMINIDKN